MYRQEDNGKRSPRAIAALLCGVLMVAACGGGESAGQGGATADSQTGASRSTAQSTSPSIETVSSGLAVTSTTAPAGVTPSDADLVRFAQQSTFGPTETMLSELKTQGTVAWAQSQFALRTSQYTSGGDGSIHENVSGVSYCSTPAQSSNPNCWRDYYSSEPLLWDFYRNAVEQPDQLRQRVALALQHILVVSNVQVEGTYGFRNYFNALIDNAFGNYRDVLRKVIQSPLMGDYLNHVDNDRNAPNENFGREMLQLFTIGNCKLNMNGTLVGGSCLPPYDNDMVRNYAYALTGWTYPPGGSAQWACLPIGSNCPFYGGDMVSAPLLRDASSRQLLSSVVVPANSTAPQALEKVLDSVMQHQNIAPFVARRMIQHLVVSNPSPAYVQRVANAFQAGSFTVQGIRFGAGVKGDLKATVAATLFDAEARQAAVPRSAGFLREPALMFAGVIRAMNGYTDGGSLGWYWGETLSQHMFRPPSVFDFYPSNYPVAGTDLVGPEFGIHNDNGALSRLNFLTYLFDWGGSPPDPTQPRSIGTAIRTTAFQSTAVTPGVLVDRLSLLAFGKPMSAASRQAVIDATTVWTQRNDGDAWRDDRVRAAAFLVFASPQYQVQR